MKQVSVKEGQSIVDIAIQYYGDPQAVWQICQDNRLEIGEELILGQSLLINSNKVNKPRIVKQLENYTVASL